MSTALFKRSGMLVSSALIFLVSNLVMAQGAHAAPACDRACLLNSTTQVLESLKKHSVKDLPLTANVKVTQNGQAIKPGEGLWTNFTSHGFTQSYADPSTGQGELYAVIDQSGKPFILSLSVKVESGKSGHKSEHKISAIELILARQDQGLFRPDLLPKLLPVFNQTVEPSRRGQRERMIQIVNRYFDGIEQGNNNLVISTSACDRYENGVNTTREEGKPNPEGCEKTPSHFPWIKKARDRRYLIVDEERGLVIVHVFLDTPPGYYPPDNPTVERAPKSVMISELFKIYDDKIQQINAILEPLPYAAKSGWEQ